MCKGRLIGPVAMLAIVLASQATHAGNDSRISLRMNLGVSSFPSDRRIDSGFYPSVGGDPVHCDAEGVMSYHFDVKFGRSGYAAICYRALKNLDLELGFGYTSIQMEIDQNGGAGKIQGLDCWCVDDCASFRFDTVKDSGFNYFTFRPGATLFLSTKRGIVPYVSAALNLMRVEAKASLDFAIPHITLEDGRYYLDRQMHLETLELSGSEIAAGFEFGSGLEFKASSTISVTFGFSYMVQFQRPFKDFGDLVAAGSSPVAKSVNYHSDGMNIRNIAALIGMKWQL